MGVFQRKPAIDEEWQKLLQKEMKWLQKRAEKSESLLSQKLEEKMPVRLKETLDQAFAKAFAFVFEKGTGVIEKTYRREELENNYKIQQYAVNLTKNRKSLQTITKTAEGSATKNLVLSGALGIGMGVLGIGLPDIPIFTGMILKSIYEIALRYGYQYESENERHYILLLIQGAVSCGASVFEINKQINTYIKTGQYHQAYSEKEQIDRTADALSNELLSMKFLQGIPIVGVVGGAYDIIFMRRITEYAELKYRRRYLYDQKLRYRGEQG